LDGALASTTVLNFDQLLMENLIYWPLCDTK